MSGSESVTGNTGWRLRRAQLSDVPELVALEKRCFSNDLLSRRQFNWMISRARSDFIVAVYEKQVVAYVLLLFHRGTSLARIYSIAVDPAMRGQGLADALMLAAEQSADAHQCVYLRLEVSLTNRGAIRLYEKHGYRQFGVLVDYYEDHSDALRYEKRITHSPAHLFLPVPFYAQTTDFTCGPACLMMAMQAIEPAIEVDRFLELQLWREATTIYMTSGHGGCSPQGLALAGWRRDFDVELYLTQSEPLFLEGVRQPQKKEVMGLVHEDFMRQIGETDIRLTYQAVNTAMLHQALQDGSVPLVLISSWRFNRNKSPHWVVVSSMDEHYAYLHDPDVDEEEHRTMADNIYMPVPREEFERMLQFGQAKIRAAVLIRRKS